jgi:hypothetical protein
MLTTSVTSIDGSFKSRVDSGQLDFIASSAYLTPKCQIEESVFVQHSNHQAPELLHQTQSVLGFQKELPKRGFYEDAFLAFVEDNEL